MFSKISVFDFSLSTAFRIFLFLGVILTSLFMGGAEAEAGTTPTIDNGGLWYYKQVIGTDYSSCQTPMVSSNQTCVESGYSGDSPTYSCTTITPSSGYVWVDRSYNDGGGEGGSMISQWQQCRSNSAYTVYSSPVATFAASTNKDTYAPGETVTVSVAASSGDQSNTIGGFFSGGIINAINNSFLNPFCALFCTSTPAVGVTATYDGGVKAHCEETGACGNSPGQTFTAPSDPGTYTINLRGWWYKSEPNEPTHSFSSMTFTVVASSCAAISIKNAADAAGGCVFNLSPGVTSSGGTYTSTSIYSPSGYTGSYTWNCSNSTWSPGSYTCTAPAGVCGTPANGKTYPSSATGYYPDTQCSVGDSTNTLFPPAGGTYAWICDNNGSKSGMCQAWRSGYTLSVITAGTGTGKVTGSGITCTRLFVDGDTCSASYASNTDVTLTATPTSGNSVSWTGCKSTSNNACTVTMDASKSVTATFTAVVSSAPVVTVWFDTTTVNWGGSSLLNWSATNNPTSCKGEWNQSLQTPSGTDRAPSGTENIGPIYGNLAREISCTNAGGTGFASASVTVLYPLFVIKSPDATAGTVTSTSVPPATGINCGETCSISYLSGTPVILTATPASGYVFTSWTGGCTGTETTCNVTMNGTRTVTATFTASAANTLTVTKSGTGTGTVRSTDNPRTIDCGTDCSETYASPTPVTLTASATSGSSFAGWSGACSGTGNCVVSVNGAKTVTATFTAAVVSSAPVVTVWFDTATVSLWGYDYLHWSATNNPTSCIGKWDNSLKTPSGTDRAPSGTENIGPIPSSGAIREIECTNAGGTGSGTATVTVSYILDIYTYGTGTGKVTGSNITCTRPSDIVNDICSWSYSSGTNVTLTATPSSGTFTGWTGACSGTGNCTVSMTQARSVTATFTAATAGSGACGTAAKRYNVGDTSYSGSSCSSVYGNSTIPTFPGEGSSSSWTCYNEGSTTTGQSCTATHDALLAVFKSGSGTVTSTTDSGINCGTTCSAGYASGTSVTLTATPSSGSNFTEWTTYPVGLCSVGTNPDTCTVSMTQSLNVTAKFTAAGNPPIGVIDSVSSGVVGSCGYASGWAYDPDVSSQSINVHVYVDGTAGSGAWGHDTGATNVSRPDVNNAYSITGVHGYGYQIPSSIATVGTHKVYAYGIGVDSSGNLDNMNPELTNSPQTFNCTAVVAGSGACGTAAKRYNVGDTSYSGSSCSSVYGNSTIPTFPGEGSSSSWTCYNEGSTTTGQSCTATHDALLAVFKSGSGTVTSTTDSGINCGTTCSAGYASGTSVTLTATPSSGSNFTEWTTYPVGLCSVGTNPDTCTVSMTQSLNVTAKFTAIGVGACGLADTHQFANSELTWGSSYPQCSSGTPSSTIFPSAGGSASWTCSGSPTCTAYKAYPTPTMSSSCDNAAGTQATLSWTSVSGADRYPVRVEDPATPGCGALPTGPTPYYCISGIEYVNDSLTSTSVTVNIAPNTSYKWWVHAVNNVTDWNGASVANQVPFSCASSSSYTLSVFLDNTSTGTGTVASSPTSTITGTPPTSASFPSGTLVTLTPTTSGTFVWSGAGTGSGARQVTMDAAKSVTIKFTAALVCPYVAPDCSATYCPPTTCGSTPANCRNGTATNCDPITKGCAPQSCGTWKEVVP